MYDYRVIKKQDQKPVSNRFPAVIKPSMHPPEP